MKKWIMAVAVAALSITAMSFVPESKSPVKAFDYPLCHTFGSDNDRQAYLAGYRLACFFLGIPVVPYEESVTQNCWNGDETCDPPVYQVCFAN